MSKSGPKPYIISNPRYIISLYVNENLSVRRIAKKAGLSEHVIYNFIKQQGVLRPHAVSQLKGEASPMWKGGRIQTEDGYIKCYTPGHPQANKGGYVCEHRLIIEKQIGRYLLESEKVHHINGIKNDNRPGNLKLVSPAEHIIYNELCSQCGLRKEIRLMRWQIRRLTEQLQGRLV